MSAHPIKLQARGVSRTYRHEGASVQALQSVDIDLHDGGFLCLLGKSGCGKSTLLHVLAGLLHPSSGTVWLDGDAVTGPTPRIGLVFQRFALFPWLNVAENVAFGLRAQRIPNVAARVDHLLDLVGLRGFAKARPAQLSGGMAQRVALARTLAPRPEVLLLDEPLGALDSFTRMALQEEVASVWQRERFTALMVTHDLEEALFLGTQVAIMSPRPGRVEQVIDVPMDYPRDRTSSEFLMLRDRVYQALHLKSAHPEHYVI